MTKTEELFGLIFQASPDAMVLLDADGQILEVNPAGLLHLQADDLVQSKSRFFIDYVLTPHKEAFARLQNTVFSGGTGLLEFEMAGLSGSRCWLEIHAAPVPAAKAHGNLLLGVFRDITERKRVVYERRVNDRVLASVSQGVIVCGPNQKIINVNDAFCSISGYQKDEILGRSCRFLQGELTDPATIERISQAISNESDFSGEILNYRKDGNFFWNELTISPVRDELGQLTHFVGVTRDITERKSAQAFQQANIKQLQSLSRRVLEAQETERRRFAIELHDELGQALTAIKINLQSHDQFKHLTIEQLIEENVKIVDDVIKQVRRLSLALRPSMLDDLGLVPALKWITEQAGARSNYEIEFKSSLPKVRLNSDIETVCFRITQEALTNITRHSHCSHVKINLLIEDDLLVLKIMDDGSGYDVPKSIQMAGEGASIGVLGMKERASLIGGKLDIESKTGQGTLVRLTCPVRLRGESE